jgi:hypothetical protein
MAFYVGAGRATQKTGVGPSTTAAILIRSRGGMARHDAQMVIGPLKMMNRGGGRR